MTTFNGLKNSQFSKNQIRATKLAQDGIDKVRIIRDRDYTVCGSVGNPTVEEWSGLWVSGGCPVNDSCIYSIKEGAVTCGTQTPFWLKLDSNQETIDIFKRKITIKDEADDPANRKRVIVEVSWDDFSGSHNSQLVTILTKY